MEREKQKPVVVRLSKNSGIEDTENLHVYVVNTGGQIVETARFNGYEATINTTKDDLEGQNKVYIAQRMPENIGGAKKNERSLLKMNAYEVVKTFNGSELSVSRLPSDVIDHYPFFHCHVTGHISKNFVIDGVSKKLPLCDLRVHVCEVETEFRWPHIPIYYERIPDWIIQELAEKIVNLPPDPIGPISGSKINLPLRSLTQKSAPQVRAKSAPANNLPENVLTSLKSGSIDVLRTTMIDYHDLLFPYFCYWPFYWPYLYLIVEDTVVTTDCNGHFELWESTFGRNPLNIYIWVEANINGQWVTVYRPSLPCYTRWGYQCNTDINIILTDPRLQPCDCGIGGPADAVWFRSIGWSASALHIEQNMLNTVNVQGVNMLNVGCTDILGSPISPFGAGLTFKLFCGANIFASGAHFYRWKYTPIAYANMTPVPLAAQIPTTITGNISRPYLVKLTATHYETHYAQLGAVGSGTDIAYRIPHQNIASEPQVPAIDQALSPTWSDVFFDSANLDSKGLTDGLYRFDLELLSQDGAGHFHVVDVARSTFQVSEANNIVSSQDAPNNYLLPHSPFLDAKSLSFYGRIDNAPCIADIHDATLLNVSGPNAVSGPCGFLKYTDPAQHVQISFEASHPRNFATFSFGIVKGNNTQATDITPHGYVGSSVSITSLIPGVSGTFTMAGGVFTDEFSVAALLNGCPGQAAFSENLYVATLATDGTNRLQGFDRHDIVLNKDFYYDPSDTNAFALSNT